MNKLVVITSVSMANGYRLAGNEAYGVANVKEATELVRKFIDNCEPVLLAIDDELFSQMDRKLIKEVYDL
jgi:vacuolar-type H+-ATPase subunit F/Vma7